MPISLPKFFQKAFAQNGGKQDVPITGDTSGGRASYDTGFPAVTRIPIVAGGIPPFGTDFNGVLYDLSQAIQYVQSGVAFPFNQDFATEIGGYEIGAIVSDASDKTLLWVNGTANNTAFPSGWTSFKRSDPTETVRGLPLKASPSEALAFLDDSKMLTPAMLAAAIKYDPSITPQVEDSFPFWGKLIMKIGRATGPSGASGSAVYTYPVAFPTASLFVAVFDESATPAGIYKISSDFAANTRTGFTYRWDGAAAAGIGGFSYLAIGY